MNDADRRLLEAVTLEDRVRRIEAFTENWWHHTLCAIEEALIQYDELTETAETPEADALPQITDRKSFIAYVSTVARHQHTKRLTGAESRALLYAAQLTYAALKGDDPRDPATHVPQLS